MEREAGASFRAFNMKEPGPTKRPDPVALRHHFDAAAGVKLLHFCLVRCPFVDFYRQIFFYEHFTVAGFRCEPNFYLPHIACSIVSGPNIIPILTPFSSVLSRNTGVEF